ATSCSIATIMQTNGPPSLKTVGKRRETYRECRIALRLVRRSISDHWTRRKNRWRPGGIFRNLGNQLRQRRHSLRQQRISHHTQFVGALIAQSRPASLQ